MNAALTQVEALTGIDRLLAVVACLRNPEGGCPWDLKQTHGSLRPYLLEESYEAVEAIDQGAPGAICEELGDVLLQVALHSQIAQDNGQFDFSAVAQGIADKLIRRHPHVFGDVSVDSAEAVTANWQAIKRQEKQAAGAQRAEGVLSGVNKAQPALLQALDTSKKAVAVGFEWPDFESLWQCVMSEYAEFKAEADAAEPDKQRLEEEFGDILFASVNLARHFNINPEVALARATQKFTRRFEAMEARVLAEAADPPADWPEPLKALSFEAWDALWEAAKRDTAK